MKLKLMTESRNINMKNERWLPALIFNGERSKPKAAQLVRGGAEASNFVSLTFWNRLIEQTIHKNKKERNWMENGTEELWLWDLNSPRNLHNAFFNTYIVFGLQSSVPLIPGSLNHRIQSCRRINILCGTHMNIWRSCRWVHFKTGVVKSLPFLWVGPGQIRQNENEMIGVVISDWKFGA